MSAGFDVWCLCFGYFVCGDFVYLYYGSAVLHRLNWRNCWFWVFDCFGFCGSWILVLVVCLGY